ncbi:hypothetical protein [Acetonema longum]|uniref:Uncharacterized protein n=1 Tax=Acetonema longum DSM 6540 TaxID=1009370 RepID=F7NMT6_9FIRM|nr:hypothetical protein [Acetonema longum]EGO62630.1 hypothetical protein ALO_17086 [Acetonema longum DSM 6540]
MFMQGIFSNFYDVNVVFNVWIKVANANAYCNDVDGIERIFFSYTA